MEKFQVDAIPELEMNSKEQFQLAMDVLVKVGASYVLVICRPENLATILDRVGRSYPEFLLENWWLFQDTPLIFWPLGS